MSDEEVDGLGRSGGGVLAAYPILQELLGLVDVPATFTVHQGDDMGRPSLITVDVPTGLDRQEIPEAASRRVYKQVACYDCGTTVVTSTINGRTAHACPRCQPA